MGEDLTLIQDLALILFCAATMSILFKKLNQPVVLGYIVAGFLAGPHMPYTETITNIESIKIWASIGVIFILFGLGLEFSFKKLFRIGSTPIIAVITSLICMTGIGCAVSNIFHWGLTTGLYLGGMLAMSSTSIIIKAFDDLGVKHQKFATMVFSVLILEDIIAIVLMLLFSMMGKEGGVNGEELVTQLILMACYIVWWFVLGIYLIPLILKWCKKFMNNEMLLILSLALCFLMVMLAHQAGFSAAFGAFVMGSILAETTEGEHIEKVITPIKDLFGAIFFVSVGMMIQPLMLLQYWIPIVVLVLVMLLLRSSVDSFSFMIGGLNIKDSVRCGFSLAQVGEFAFILAAMGVSEGAIDDFLYPVIVSVSVITTFTTPFMIKISEPLGAKLQSVFPEKMKLVHKKHEEESDLHIAETASGKFVKNSILVMVIYTVICFFISFMCLHYLYPYLASTLSDERWDEMMAPLNGVATPLYNFLIRIDIAKLTTAIINILALATFVRPLLVNGMYNEKFEQMWNDKNTKHAPVIFVIILRHILAVLIVSFTIGVLYRSLYAVIAGVIVFLIISRLTKKMVNKRIDKIETIFKENYNAKENAKKPKYAGNLVDTGVHLSEIEIPYNSKWCGHTIASTNWGKDYDVHIVSIIRDNGRLNIPDANTMLFPSDKIQLLGSDENLARFAQILVNKENLIEVKPTTTEDILVLRKIAVPNNSIFENTTIANCGIRDDFHCLIVGIDRGEGVLIKPTAKLVIASGDFITVVGETKDITALQIKANTLKS